jgi:hypothetical protein
MIGRISSSTRGKARTGRSVVSSVAYGGLDPTLSSGIFTKMARAAGRETAALFPLCPRTCYMASIVRTLATFPAMRIALSRRRMKTRKTMRRIKGVTSRETRGIEEGRLGSQMEIHDEGPESRTDSGDEPGCILTL